jgi:hypothetical protein
VGPVRRSAQDSIYAQIDGIWAKEFFLPYGMEVDGRGGFLLPLICLLTWTWDPSM